ncbi:PAS domain-containing sensor histidine kinase [Arenibaculum sp.]|uniref:PAS domain-containing sensor histidine kinase n=1 Tax=Arenibaculum sp. TaxID=2865862 RepID=UPI002E1498C0|nr:ATP-binding protein [Arenibaculum sp.]
MFDAPAASTVFTARCEAAGHVTISLKPVDTPEGLTHAIEELANHCLRTGYPVDEELEFEGCEGKPWRWRIVLLPDPDHPRSRALGTLRRADGGGNDAAQMPAQLQEARDLLRLVLDATRDGIIDWDLDGRRVWFSPRWKALLGYQDHELPNDVSTWKRLVLPEDQALGIRLVRDLFTDSRSRDPGLTVRLRHKDGSIRHMLVRATSVQDAAGKPMRMIGAYTDVTQIMEAQRALLEAKEEAERASKAKSVFLALMSHELRTPLNAIIGFSGLIADEAFGSLSDPQYLDCARDILAGGRQLLAVINDILDLARLEADGTELDLRPTAPDTILCDAVLAHEAAAAAAGLELRVESEPGLPLLLADRSMMARAVASLVSNAVKFTPGSGRVVVSARRAEGGAVALSVQDTGIGMDPSDVPLALEPFSQLENLFVRQRDGVGLGLPAARRIAELHGAAFSIETLPGSGTTVVIGFPPGRTTQAS